LGPILGPKIDPLGTPADPPKWPKMAKIGLFGRFGPEISGPRFPGFCHFLGRIFLNQAARTPKNVTKEH